MVERYFFKLNKNGLELWTWNSEGINELEKCFEKFCKIIPDKRKGLGIYM